MPNYARYLREAFCTASSPFLSSSAKRRRDLWLFRNSVPALAGAIEADLRRDDGSFLHPRVTILGSGPSITELSDQSKDAIGRWPTIAMNRYTIFWELINIWPTYVFLADSRGVAPRVFSRTLQTIAGKTDAPPPTLLLEEFYCNSVPTEMTGWFFRRNDVNGNNLHWADSANDPMFFCRGSLTTLLNVIAVFRIAPKVGLIGVDLNRPGAFYDTARESEPKLFNAWDDVAAEKGVHASVTPVNGWKGSMLDQWKVVQQNLEQDGIELVSLSEGSQLVQEGLCEFVSPCEFE